MTTPDPHSPTQPQPQLQPQPQYSPKQSPVPTVSRPSPPKRETIARKLQRIDILLNLVYSRVTNDRSLIALFPYLSENDAHNLVSDFTYVRHQQDNQEIKSHMTDKQLYRIFRHHYRAEQRLADTIRKLRNSASSSASEQPTRRQQPQQSTSSPLTRAIHDLENNTARARTLHLQQAHSELNQISDLYETKEDFLYTHEFSQPQQITTMQARCLAMKDEYDADDLRNGRLVENADAIQKAPQISISGPEDWEHGMRDQHPPAASASPGFGLINPQWTPPDPPRSPSPEQRHLGPRQRQPRQRRYSRRQSPVHDYSRGRRHRQDGQPIHASSTRPGRSQPKSRTHRVPVPKRHYYSNDEFATMPNLRRRPPSHRKHFPYDDAYVPHRRGPAPYYANHAESIDPFAKPYPHQSADAFGWKQPQGILSSQYYSDFAAAHRAKPVPPPPPPDPYAEEYGSVPSAYHDDGADYQTPIGEPLGTGKRKKWDEWRYHNGLSPGHLEDKNSGGVMHSIANMVKGRKENHGVPHNPIQAMQFARNDPVKFMTTMVAGEVMPQAKRKAKKFEAMLGHDPHESGPVGQVLSKMTKNSMPHGDSSHQKITGQVGKKLAKMTMESAMGGSSKHHGTGPVGKVLTKVAKESLKHSTKSSGGAGMINKVMNTLGTK